MAHKNPQTPDTRLTPADKQIQSRLQIPVLPDNIKPWTMRFQRIQVTMTHNQRFRIMLMQILQQTSQRNLLRLGPSVAGSTAVSSQSSHISHPDGVTVMVPAMRSHHLLRPARLNRSVRRNHVVVAAAYPAQRPMIAVDVLHAEGTARPVSGAVHNNQSDSPHRFRTVARQRHPLHRSVPVQSHGSHRAQCSSSSSSYA